jgi:hypothetical protein
MVDSKEVVTIGKETGGGKNESFGILILEEV